jgi:hypothetical protein
MREVSPEASTFTGLTDLPDEPAVVGGSPEIVDLLGCNGL